MVELLRTLQFSRVRALRAMAHGSRSPLLASWHVAHCFYVLSPAGDFQGSSHALA